MTDQVKVVFNKDFLPMTMGIHDPVLLREIYGEYLDSLAQLLQLLQGAPDPRRLFTDVHKLKSSSASIGARCLSEFLSELEHLLLSGQDHSSQLAALDLLCRQTMEVIARYTETLVAPD